MRIGILCLAILLMSALLSSAALTIDTDDTLPPGTVGSAYSVQLSSSGGTPPYKWMSYALPRGMTMSTDGVLRGTPVAENVRLTRGSSYATFPLSVFVTDSSLPQIFSAKVMYLQINCKSSGYWPDICELAAD